MPQQLQGSEIVAAKRTPSDGGLSSRGLFNAAGTNAGGTDANVLARAFDYGFDPPQIRIPAAPGNVVRVADCVSKQRLLAAKFTCECHCCVAPDGRIVRLN